MKKLIALLLAVLLMVPAFAMAASVDVAALSDAELAELAEKIAVEQRDRLKANTQYLASGNLGVHFIGIKSVEMVKDIMGNDALNITINYYHDDPANTYMPVIAYGEEVTQDDQPMERTYVVGDDRANNSDAMRSLKVGEMVELSSAYALKDATKPVVITYRQPGIFVGPVEDEQLITYTWQP